MTHGPGRDLAHPDDDKPMAPTYVRVVVVQLVVLAALWFFQEYFSH